MDYQRLTIYIIPYNILYIIPFSVDYIIICGYLLGCCTTISTYTGAKNRGMFGMTVRRIPTNTQLTIPFLCFFPTVFLGRIAWNSLDVLKPAADCFHDPPVLKHALRESPPFIYCLVVSNIWISIFLFCISYMGSHPPTIDELHHFSEG